MRSTPPKPLLQRHLWLRLFLAALILGGAGVGEWLSIRQSHGSSQDAAIGEVVLGIFIAFIAVGRRRRRGE